MPIGERQSFITELLEKALGQKAERNIKFEWFIYKHSDLHFGNYYNKIEKIFIGLGGDPIANQTKRTTNLRCDAYFAGRYNFIFEFDEYQHFSSARYMTLNNYPTDVKVNFSIDHWKQTCLEVRNRADKYRYSKSTTDFDFNGGRTRQRAYLDCFRDLLPSQNYLNPTLRINEFEVSDILRNDKNSQLKLWKIVERKLKPL